MRTFLIFLSCFVFFFPARAQTAKVLDSVAAVRLSNERLKPFTISCQGSLKESEEPLYIVDGIPLEKIDAWFANIATEDIASISVLKTPPAIWCYGTAAKNGVVLITTNSARSKKEVSHEYPFKTYCIPNGNWIIKQDIFNAIQAKVPGIQIQNFESNSTPVISIRGDDNTIVIVDGVRYDASILNTLNPTDIEKITVANSIAAGNYLINHQNPIR